jgi:hypothetical protein
MLFLMILCCVFISKKNENWLSMILARFVSLAQKQVCHQGNPCLISWTEAVQMPPSKDGKYWNEVAQGKKQICVITTGRYQVRNLPLVIKKPVKYCYLTGTKQKTNTMNKH